MSGADRYHDTLLGLKEIHEASKETPLTVDQRIAVAQVEATLAVAAAVALGVVTPFVGDSQDITDWARLIAADAMVGGRRKPIDAQVWPENWPPQVGDVWQDRHDDCWLFESSGVLIRLTGGADDTPAEIHRVYGPLKLERRPAKTNRCPF